MKGKRIFVKGHSVNKVKRAVGSLAKKVQVSGDGTVEVIGPMKYRPRCGLYRLWDIIESL